MTCRALRLLVAACSLAALGGLAACHDDAASPAVGAADACELSVGWDPWEPYQYEDTEGTLRGLDVEIAGLLAADAGCTLRYVRGDWIDVLEEMRAGRIDMAFGATAMPEREAFARFSAPYREEAFALYVRAKDFAALAPHDLRTLAAAGRRIGYTEGYFYGDDVRALLADRRTAQSFVAAPVVAVSYLRLMAGEIDALLDDPFVATAMLRRKGWSERVVRHPQAITSGRVALMFSRRSVGAAVVERFDQGLARRRADGTLMQVIARYQQ